MSIWIRACSIQRLSLVPVLGFVFIEGSGGVPQDEPTGRITGTVELANDLIARRPTFRLYSGYGPGSVRDPRQEAGDPSPVVVYLEGAPGARARSGQRATVEQRDERFSPHVVAVLQGTTIDFPNRDPFFHNVFSLSKAKSFDLGRYAQGEAASITFDRPGVVQVYCQIHSDMSGYILVLDNEFYTVVDRDGQFVIDNIPVGEYELVAWHERTTPVREVVRVARDSTSEVDVVLPLDRSNDGL